MTVTVLARIETVPGQRDAFLSEFAKVVPLVHQEDGCLEYGPTIDLPTGNDRQTELGENVVMIVEKWTSLAALEAHLDAPHMHAYRPKVKDLIAGSSLHILQAPAGICGTP